MTKGLGAWLFGYGVFLFACGAAAFLLNPNQAPTPLVAGAGAGGMAAFLGVLAWNGTKWVPRFSLVMTVIFMMLGLALAMQHWMLVYSGKPEVPAALLSVAVFIGSSVMLWALKTKA